MINDLEEAPFLDDGDFSPKFEDIAIPAEEERGDNWFAAVFTRGIDGIDWTEEAADEFARYEAEAKAAAAATCG